MMLSGTSSICALCTCQPSVSVCEGCQRKFCLLCISRHRNELSLELDDLFNRRNEMVEMMQTQLSSNATDRSPYFEEINRWQTEMRANVDRVASAARDSVRQRLEELNGNVRTDFDRISQDLQQKQKTGGYFEGDLNRIRQQLIKLNDTVQRFKEQIRIDTSGSRAIAWDSLVSVKSTKDTPPVVPSSPVSNNYSRPNRAVNSGYDSTMPPPYYSIVSTAASLPPSRNAYQRSSVPTIPTSRNSLGRTFTCVGCKTTNDFNAHGPNVCSVCRCPARI